MKAHFYFPFLAMYDLEKEGIVSTWYVLSMYEKKTIHHEGREYVMSRIEAVIEDYEVFQRYIGDLEAYMEFTDSVRDDIPPYIEPPHVGIVKPLLNNLKRNNMRWYRQRSRFLQWNLSYADLCGMDMTIELFPNHLCTFFWVDERADYIVTPYHYYKSAAEVLRRATSFAWECSNQKKAGVFETKLFYLSLVIPSNRVSNLMGEYIRGNREFLHKDFHKWGRFTANDDPRIYLPKGEYPLRKIRF